MIDENELLNQLYKYDIPLSSCEQFERLIEGAPKMLESIWVITVGYMDKRERFVPVESPAFYFDKHNALKALEANNADIHKATYDYAVLEKVQEGCYGTTGIKEWFKYDKEKDGYFPILEPENEKHYSGYGIL